MSVSGIVSDDSPIFMNRPVTETGGIITGGAAQVGSVGITVAIRSCTNCRAQELVGAGLEQHLDRRQVGKALGAHDVETIDAVERLLQRNGDEGLDFLCGETQAGGLNLDARRRELGKDVHRHAAELRHAEQHHRRGDRQHDEAKFQACSDNPTYHGWSTPPRGHSSSNSFSDPYNSAAPTVTTRVPVDGPSDRTAWSPSMLVDLDWVTDVGQRFGIGVRPGVALGVVEDGGVGNDLARRPSDVFVTHRGRLDVDPFRRVLGQRHAGGLRPLEMLDLGRSAFFFFFLCNLSARRQLQAGDEKQRNRPTIQCVSWIAPGLCLVIEHVVRSLPGYAWSLPIRRQTFRREHHRRSRTRSAPARS